MLEFIIFVIIMAAIFGGRPIYRRHRPPFFGPHIFFGGPRHTGFRPPHMHGGFGGPRGGFGGPRGGFGGHRGGGGHTRGGGAGRW